MADAITAVNQKIMGVFTGAGSINWMSILGWIFFVIILVAAGFAGYMWYKNKRIFNKKCTILEIVGVNYVPVMTDMAKVVKIGTGGFEILFFKKLKIYRIGYGGRVGKSDYYFFIGKDGYWYNGMLSADIHAIDKNKGLIPIVTTNPAMRSQYTSLEKQIDVLHSEKKGFMEKYGMGAGFVIVIGVFFLLIAKELSPVMGQMASISEKQGYLVQHLDTIISNLNIGAQNISTGLVPVR